MSGKLRGYFVYDKWGELGVAVVAHTGNEAKKIGFPSVEGMNGSEWIDVTTRRIKDADVSELETPAELSLYEGLRRGILGYAEGIDCELCGKESAHCECFDGKIVCLDCMGKLEARRETK